MFQVCFRPYDVRDNGSIFTLSSFVSGLFTPVRDNGSLFTPIYYRIYNVAECDCERFAICDINGINAYEVDEKSEQFSPIYIKQGTILRKMGTTKLPQNLTNPSSGKKTVTYLKCKDYLNRNIVISYSLKGEFLPAASSGKATLIRMQNIDRTKLPYNLKLIAGSKPDTPSLLDSLLRLTSHSMENHMMASTISNVRNVFVELDLNLNMKFHVARDDNMRNNPEYSAALLQCETKESEYAKK